MPKHCLLKKPDGPGKWFKKGNRNEVEGKTIAGRKDSIISNGKDNQNYSTLNWRTFRYVEIKITTKKEPLVIEDIYSLFTGYPFQLNAEFNANDKMLDKIFEVGWLMYLHVGNIYPYLWCQHTIFYSHPSNCVE